jgi:hypothetical protein
LSYFFLDKLADGTILGIVRLYDSYFAVGDPWISQTDQAVPVSSPAAGQRQKGSLADRPVALEFHRLRD